MSIWKAIPTAALAAACIWTTAAAQEPARPKELTARELFYVAAEAPKPVSPKPSSKIPEPKVAPKTAVKSPVPAASKLRPAAVPASPRAAPDGTAIISASAPVRRTAPAPVTGPPLGLRYTITKLVDGKMVEVPTDTVFRASDRIKITIVPNSPGYLYIVHQGSSGTWMPIFPSPEIADGNNRVEGFRDYPMPPKSRMLFDERPGSEKLFVILSREPQLDFEGLIYSLQAPRSKPASSAEPEAPAKAPARTMVAANISNETVGRLREVYARDLVIEKVDDDTPGDKKEMAVYVVNPSGSPDARVVADINLVHQ